MFKYPKKKMHSLNLTGSPLEIGIFQTIEKISGKKFAKLGLEFGMCQIYP